MKHKIFWDLEIQLGHPILSRRSDLVLINKNKRTCHRLYFTISAGHKVKMKENE